MFQVGDTVRVRTGLAIGDDSLMSCAGRNLHVVAILQGGLVRCRYFHNNHTIDAAIKSEFLMLTATSIPPETKPLVCLNQHPEHQWEYSGFHLWSEQNLGNGGWGTIPRIGPPVEVCSRPGCGLIRVRQEKKKPDLGWDNAFGKIEDEDEKPVFDIKSLPLPVMHLDRPLSGIEPPKKVKEVVEKTYIGQETNKVYGGESLSQRCERCQCLTPVSELSRDAQGRMVCRHHG